MVYNLFLTQLCFVSVSHDIRMGHSQTFFPHPPHRPSSHIDVMDKLTAFFMGGIRTYHVLLTGLQNIILHVQSLSQWCLDMGVNVNRICGTISVYMHTLTNHTFKICLLSGYTTMITFHRFNMLYSHQCGINMLRLRKTIPPKHEDHYCGFMPPWTEMCPCRNIHLQLVIRLSTPITEITLSYSIKKNPVLTTYRVVLKTWSIGRWSTVEFMSRYGPHQQTSAVIIIEKWQLIRIIMNYTGRPTH